MSPNNDSNKRQRNSTAVYDYPLGLMIFGLSLTGVILVVLLILTTGILLAPFSLFVEGAGEAALWTFILCFLLMIIFLCLYHIGNFLPVRLDNQGILVRQFFFKKHIKYSDIESVKLINTQNMRLPLPSRKSLAIIRIKSRFILFRYIFIGDGMSRYDELVNRLREQIR